MSIVVPFLTIKELSHIRYELTRWGELFPYEKEQILRRSKELALQYQDIAGEDLTNGILDAIKDLTISR